MTHDSGGSIRFPPLYHAAEAISAESQTRYSRARAAEFSALVIAAAASSVPSDVAAGLGPIVALVSFMVAFIIRVSGIAERAEDRWYEARAAAESIKSMSWQYAVGGEAFRIDDDEARDRFAEAVHDILHSLKDLDAPAGPESGIGITQGMNGVRRRPRPERRAVYLAERVEDQLAWYTKKSHDNKEMARRWRRLSLAVEVVALGLGLLRVLGTFDVDWLSVLAAAGAAAGAWQQTKNYAVLSKVYAITTQDVHLVNDDLDEERGEPEWAAAVHDAEAAFSREHKMWRSRKQGPQLAT